MNVPLQLVMGITPAHRNQYLFSDHYLDNLLPQDPRWESALPQAETFLTWLQGLYAREQHQLPNYNETQLEEHWFKPILTQLGHVFEGQAGVPGLNHGVKWPDYVFFPDEATRQAAVGAQNTEEYAADALAVGEVKHWDVPLSKKQKGGEASFEAQNPSWQTDYYLRATGLDWGILSNGRRWRLVHKDTSQRLSIYYEVDLVDLLSRGDARVMRYFTLFFHQAAFRPDAQGRVFLADVLAESHAYAVALEEDVEANVYQALERLMQGFLDLPANGLGTEDLRPATLRAIYENSLYLLYRLLFILYGESRGLLPLHLTSYRDSYSLDRIKREIAEIQTPPAPMTTIYWGRLKQLFQIINGDNVALNRHLGVPRYNGRLFDPKLHPFLETCAVGDRALVDAIDLLSRRTTTPGREFVDYRTLGVRHLGSIYEGLLEYQPRYAIEQTVAVRDGKGERWVAEAELERPLGSRKTPRVVDRREAGQVYLETDRGERKATGSYYTPQYIVEYIVENTLGPLVEEAVERVKARAKEAKGKAARAEAEQSLVDEILDLKCLDPAMGSGHFLVEATEYLARALATDPYVETEAPVEEDLTYWKRRVVERCIYGVDKNPLAVELAKLSLWLATVAADKPLSFLDYHLQCGDSLIGARVADLGWAPPAVLSKKAQQQLEQQKAGQVNMFEYMLSQQLPVVMGRILEITEVESDSYETVQAKEAADEAVRQLKAPFQAVANLWTSAYFGNEFTQSEYDEVLGLTGRRDDLLALPAVQWAQEMARERRFFHWELAFPEVFYDKNGQPLGEQAGFGAVVGNPPYVSIIGRSRIEKTYYSEAFSTYRFRADIYGLFIERGLSALRSGGYFGYIVPSTLMNSGSYKWLRTRILESTSLQDILMFKDGVFDEAVVPTVVIVTHKKPADTANLIRVFRNIRDFQDGEYDRVDVHQSAFTSLEEKVFNINLDVQTEALINKPQANSWRLDELMDVSRGVNTGDDSQYLVDEKLEDAHRVLRGADIGRYRLQWAGLYVVYKPDELHDPARRENFEHPDKLLMRRLGSDLTVTWDRGRFFVMDTLYTMVPLRLDIENGYLLAVLNSNYLSKYYQLLVPIKGRTFPELRIFDVNKLPIRRIDFTTPAEEREALVVEAKANAEATIRALAASGVVGSDTPMDRAVLTQAASLALSFIEDRLDQEPKQADVIHDLLAHLAEQMIAMNKQKRAAVEAFWLDIEGMVEGAAFETLRHKGKQECTLWKQAAACRPFVSEESHATRRLDESLGWGEDAFKVFVKALVGRVPNLSDLVAVYRAHSPAYRELVERIEATDWLIDQIVYKLYGLTEEEIAIVEGRGE